MKNSSDGDAEWHKLPHNHGVEQRAGLVIGNGGMEANAQLLAPIKERRA